MNIESVIFLAYLAIKCIFISVSSITLDFECLQKPNCNISNNEESNDFSARFLLLSCGRVGASPQSVTDEDCLQDGLDNLHNGHCDKQEIAVQNGRHHTEESEEQDARETDDQEDIINRTDVMFDNVQGSNCIECYHAGDSHDNQ